MIVMALTDGDINGHPLTYMQIRTAPPSACAMSALVTMEMSAGCRKGNVNISNMGRSTIKHHVGRGGHGGRGFRPKPPVGGLITSEGQRCRSQPCVFCLLVVDKLLSGR